MNDLTSSIPRCISYLIQRESKSNNLDCAPDRAFPQDRKTLFHTSLTDLTQSYGNICTDKAVYAELPKQKRQDQVFWSAMCQGHVRSPKTIQIQAFTTCLGFHPTNTNQKRDLIDGAARLLTRITLTTDEERDRWTDRFADVVFPGYTEYAPLLRMTWKE